MSERRLKGVTSYSGLSKFYFERLLKQIIKIGDLQKTESSILDFGCGVGELKRILGRPNVIGYDIVPELTDIVDWRLASFDILVANQVFYSFSEEDLSDLLAQLEKVNPNLSIIVGISRQGWLNNIGKLLLGRPDAHSATKLNPREEVEVLMKKCTIVKSKNIMNLANIYLMRFK